MIVYISIGNSDDRLSQRKWVTYVSEVEEVLAWAYHRHGTVHGNWRSQPDAPWQNACWCIEFNDADLYPDTIDKLQAHLVRLADRHRQDSVAWAEVKETVFLGSPM